MLRRKDANTFMSKAREYVLKEKKRRPVSGQKASAHLPREDPPPVLAWITSVRHNFKKDHAKITRRSNFFINKSIHICT